MFEIAETYCPYCYGKNISKVVYSFRGVNKRKDKNINYDEYLKDNTVLGKRIITKKYDFDGEKIKTCKSYNRYCNDCDRMFTSMRNMIYVDIKKIDIVLGTNLSRKKYIFEFYDDKNPTYCYKENYITIKEGSLDNIDIYNILNALKKHKTNKWRGIYGKTYNFDNYYWLLKIEYYNGISDVKSGNDKYPDNWNSFMNLINQTLYKYDIK